MNIFLSPQLTAEHQGLIIRYIEQPGTLSRQEWRDVLYAFDLLRVSTVRYEQEMFTFGAFYERFVDTPFADRFLRELMAQGEVETVAGRLMSAYSREVRQTLGDIGLRPPMNTPLRLLLTYCLYWWASFAKGYALELAVFRDLEAANIVFQAHDLLDRQARYTPYDLIVSGEEGDIKASAYFLYVARSFPLRCKFYILRVFDTRSRQWRRLVLLKRVAWDKIDGTTTFRTLEQALNVPAVPIETHISGEAVVVVDYALWKRHILQFQQKDKVNGTENV